MPGLSIVDETLSATVPAAVNPAQAAAGGLDHARPHAKHTDFFGAYGAPYTTGSTEEWPRRT